MPTYKVGCPDSLTIATQANPLDSQNPHLIFLLVFCKKNASKSAHAIGVEIIFLPPDDVLGS